MRCDQNDRAIRIAHLLRLPVIKLIFCTGLAVFEVDRAEAFDLHLEYRVSWGNVDVASTTADWSFEPTHFELAATSHTMGLTDTFRRYRGKLQVSGKIENGRYMPKTLFLSGVSKRRSREAFTSWDQATGVISTDRTPELDLEKVFPLDDQHIKHAIDPLSAMLNVLSRFEQEGVCGGSAQIYDGLRTSQITLHDLGSTVLTKDRPFGFEGETGVCGFTGKPTGGHLRKSRWRKEERKPEDVVVFVAEVKPGLFLPVRMEIKSFIGKVTVRLVMPRLRVSDGIVRN